MEYSIHHRGYLECLEYSRHARYVRRELKFKLLLLMNCLELNSGVAFSGQNAARLVIRKAKSDNRD